jgi:cobalt/nickel transport system permease protein
LRAVPEGLNRYNGFWSHTVLGDYSFAGGQNANLAYWLSALVGIAVIGLVIFGIGKLVGWITSGRPSDEASGDGEHVTTSA